MVLALAGATGLLLGQSAPDPAAPGVPAPTPAPEATSPPGDPPEPTDAPPNQPVDLSSGPIEFRPAGELVIAYYNGLDDPASAWRMLSPAAQAAFGSESEFRSYWDQYSRVSAHRARAVRNDDGSVNMSVDVVYNGEREERKVVRVTRLDGRLLIDSEAR